MNHDMGGRLGALLFFWSLYVSFLCFVYGWLLASHRHLHRLRNWTLQVKDYIKIIVPKFGWLQFPIFLKNRVWWKNLCFLKVLGLAGWSCLFLPAFHQQKSWDTFLQDLLVQVMDFWLVYLMRDAWDEWMQFTYIFIYIYMVDFF